MRGAELFANLERVLGDRTADLDRLRGREFDAVIDTCGYIPAPVEASASAFATRARRYLFVSSISVYDLNARPLDENAPLLEMPAGEPTDTLRLERYGELKVLCERAAGAAFGRDRTILLRPGLIVGPHDASDRYTYWPARAARGATILAPGAPSDGVQYIDVRDLAAFAVTLLERDASGAFNATAPIGAFSMGSMLDACLAAVDGDGVARDVRWVDHATLLAHGVAPWTELPLWIPPGEDEGIHRAIVDRALAHGLTLRDERETARDTLTWERTRPRGHAWKAGMRAEREAELLRAHGTVGS